MRHKVFSCHKPQYHYLITALQIVPHAHTQQVLDECVKHFWKEEQEGTKDQRFITKTSK